jgi:outer membrane PBP1 activator LpoA protein
MQSRSNSVAHWFAGMVLLTACSTTPVPPGSRPATQPQSPATADRQTSQAERLARAGDHRGAAQAYEALAARASAEQRDRMLLQAARQYLQAGDADKAASTLTQVSAMLPSQDAAARAAVAAELALRAQRADKALAELDEIQQPLPPESVAEVLGLRARALFALERPAAGIIAALDRERALSTPAEQRANQRLIWEGLRNAGSNADFTPPPGSSSVVTGWLELGRAASGAARNPFTASNELTQWPQRYPTHPANAFVTEEVLPQLGVGLAFPSPIALILPLSGRQQLEGVAVRDGFLAALLQQQASERPLLNVYDSAVLGAATAYQRAVAEGAQFIIGPLTKPDVTAIATGPLTVPTLALNQLAEETPAPSQFYQFALDPEDEARQVAQRAVADRHMRSLVLLPKDAWGERVYRAFEAELNLLGGAVTAVSFYEPTARDYSNAISKMLLIDESRQRASALNAALGVRLEFEPRHRADGQFVFIGANPAQGRLLRPSLRFHLAENLPIYATSHIYEPDAQANSDLDGVLFPNMPLIISSDPVSTDLRGELSKYWPARARGNARLYAFGFDSYRIIPLLKSGQFGNGQIVPGMTGALSIDGKGRVRRELQWARVSEGKPVALDGETAAQ